MGESLKDFPSWIIAFSPQLWLSVRPLVLESSVAPGDVG